MSVISCPNSNKIGFRLSRWSSVTDAAMEAIGAAFETKLVPHVPGNTAKSDALIQLGEDSEWGHPQVHPGRTLAAPAIQPPDGTVINTITITGMIPGKPWMRGRTLAFPGSIRIAPLRVTQGSEVLASSSAGPVWVREKVESGLIDRVAFPIAGIEPARPVFEWLNSAAFPQLLPLIQFIREVNGKSNWNSNLKACFMFDDPNLHARTYGFIDFRNLVTQAIKHRYHVSFATVPLDAWFVSSKASSLFRENSAYLSLLFHGNDHILKELARIYTESDRRSLLAQAICRIQRLERVSRVEVCRVMAAPHGACSEDMMRDMAGIGFEAACISHSSQRAHNSDRAWSKHIGSRPAEVIAGLPVIARIAFPNNDFQRILLSAYLGQPIIPYGHHWDVARGLKLLNGLADQINELGEVQWMSISDICKNHYEWRRDNDILSIILYSNCIKICIPEGIKHLRVVPRNGADPEAEVTIAIRSNSETVYLKPMQMYSTAPGEDLIIRSVAVDGFVPSGTSMPKQKFWPFFRRLACEARDRSRPWFSRIKGSN